MGERDEEDVFKEMRGAPLQREANRISGATLKHAVVNESDQETEREQRGEEEGEREAGRGTRCLSVGRGLASPKSEEGKVLFI